MDCLYIKGESQIRTILYISKVITKTSHVAPLPQATTLEVPPFRCPNVL